MTGARKFDHISPILDQLGWRKIDDLIKHRDCIKVSKALNNANTPEAIKSLFVRRSAVSQRVTRATASGELQLQPFRLSLARSNFSYRVAWNNLPAAASTARM